MASFQEQFFHYVVSIGGSIEQVKPLERICFEEAIESSLLAFIKEKELDGYVVVLCDEDTYPVLGMRIEETLLSVQSGLMVLSRGVKSTDEVCQKVEQFMLHSKATCIVAVGAGTISDIGKYVSFVTGVPYICCPTAPSMNGYVSRNASLIVEGYRTSKQATLPMAVMIDRNVISRAPTNLIRAGIGDSLCRSTVQFDMLLAHYLVGSEYNKVLFDGMLPLEHGLCDQLELVMQGDVKAVSGLMQLLLLSGIAMTIAGSSAPASQGEHMIAHSLEMLYPDIMAKYFHGQQIALTTVAMLKHQQHLLESDIIKVRDDVSLDYLIEVFGTQIGEACYKAYSSKQLLLNNVNITGEAWKEMQQNLRMLGIKTEILLSYFDRIGLSVGVDNFCLNEVQFKTACDIACYTRDRVTSLDVKTLGG